MILASLGLVFLARPAAAARRDVFEQVVVTVNGEPLTRRTLDERTRAVLAQQLGRPISAEDLQHNPDLLRRARDVAPAVTAGAIDELLVLQHARDIGVDAGDDDVDRVIARMREDAHIDSDAAFEALLRSQAIPAAGLRETIRAQIVIEEMRQGAARIAVTDGEAEAYYSAHAAAFAAPARVIYREIVVALPAAPPPGSHSELDDYDRAIMRFVAAQERIAQGEDFATVARAVSDAESSRKGGDVGPVPLADLAAPVLAALGQLAPGQVSAPVRTADGYQLLQLERLMPAQSSTFASAHDAVVAEMIAARRAAAFAAEVTRWRVEALIVWKDSTLQAACARLPR